MPLHKTAKFLYSAQPYTCPSTIHHSGPIRSQIASRGRTKITIAEDIDPQLRAAIPEAPAMLTGVAQTHLNQLKEKALREVHGSLIDEIAELSSAIDVSASAVEAGRDSTRLDTGMTPEQFDSAAKPIETRQGVAWLRRRGAETRVVDLERRLEREATADELATGIEAATHAEFLAKRDAA